MIYNRLAEILKKKPYLTALLITSVILIVYLPTMNTYIMGDDFEWLDSSYSGWSHPTRLLELINNFFRPVIKFSYLLNYTFSKTNPTLYNVFTVLFHLINIFLLFRLIFKITGQTKIAGLTAFTFGISALYSEVTLWSAARTESLLLMFILAVLLQLAHLFDNHQKKKQGVHHLFILFFALLAAGSKETWVLLPFLAFCFLWLVKQVPFKTALKNTAGLFVLLVIYLGYFIGGPLLASKAAPTAYGHLDIAHMLDKFGYMFFKYVGLGDYFYGSLWQFLLLSLVLVGVLVLLIWRKNHLALFGYFWMMVMVGISLPVYYAPSRYHYLPLVGFWIMITTFMGTELPELAQRFNIRKKTLGLIIIVVLLFYSVYQVMMIQVEIQDYHNRGALHEPLVKMFEQINARLPLDGPILFIDMGTRLAVNELNRSIRGYKKLLYARELAIWQQVFLCPLANFAGQPFKRIMEPIPTTEWEVTLKNNCTVLVFTDTGFFIPTTAEFKQRVLDYYHYNRQLPPKVELLHFTTAR